MSLRLAHLSDIHFGGDEHPDAVPAAAEWLRASAVDLTIVSGDLTRYGEIPEFEAAARFLDGLPGPRLLVPGNHDAPYLAWTERFVSPFRRYAHRFGELAPRWTGAGVAVSGVNTARGVQPRLNWSKGQIARRHAREAAAWLAGQDGCRIVVAHHPLIEMLGGPMTARCWGGERAAEHFAEAGVDLVLSGHIHAPFAWPYPYGDGRTYAVGAGTLSIRERGCPPGFNLIEVEEGCLRVTALGWKGSGFEPWRTWALDRRPGRGGS